MEGGGVDLHDVIQCRIATVDLSDQLCSPKSVLGFSGASTRNEDRAIVYCNGDDLFGYPQWIVPKRSWKGVMTE